MLSAAELDELTAIIDDPATWPPPLFAPIDDARERFDVLDAEVRTAYVRRTWWRLLTSLGVGAAVIFAGPPSSSATPSC
jgi:hypothetical protein